MNKNIKLEDTGKEYYKLKFKEEVINEKIKCLIQSYIAENDGRITFTRGNDDDYPLTTICSRRKDIYFISITYGCISG